MTGKSCTIGGALLLCTGLVLAWGIQSCGSSGDRAGYAPPVQVFSYDNPVQNTSPWPMFRRTTRNNGRSPVIPVKRGLEPWSFDTGKGMFHGPVIAGDGTIYMGSADTNFYALNPDGTEKWRVETGELIDSTAVIGDDGTVYVPCGDGYLRALNPDGTPQWALQPLGDQGFLTWWEGHLTMDRNGILFAGNDDRRMYAISRQGQILWHVMTGDQVWSVAAFGNDDAVFFGSNDARLYAVDHEGQSVGTWLTLGPVCASPAVSDDGTLVVFGSFDGYIHAIDPEASLVDRWNVPTRDHIYGSPALAADGTVYAGSADGTLYAINPGDGSLKWAFDTLDPIRSSVVIDGEGTVYFGAGDGVLYAITPDGARKWSFDTSLSDRNDLNGSPALGHLGVVIGGESGRIWFVPYDYCETHASDARCNTSPGEDIARDGALLYAYSVGGSSKEEVPGSPGANDVFTFRLVVRQAGDTVLARIDPATLEVQVSPEAGFTTEVSANGCFVDLIPTQPLAAATPYTVTISGDYLVNPTRYGNRTEGGEKGGTFGRSFSFTTAAVTAQTIPLAVGDQDVSVFSLRRLAVPQPPMMTTFNQIGFDSYNFLLSPLSLDPATGRFAIVAFEGTPGLTPHPLPGTKSIFVLNGVMTGDYLTMESGGFGLTFNNVDIITDRFIINGHLDQKLSSDSLGVYAEVTCANIEFFGAQLDMVGLCNPDSGKMVLNGTAMTRPVDYYGQRPDITVETVSLQPAAGGPPAGTLDVAFAPGHALKADSHAVAVLLLNAQGRAAEVSYGLDTTVTTDADGLLSGVTLALDGDLDAAGMTAVVVVDLFPVHRQQVSWPSK